ncbi:MAG: hypothetical protein OQK82_01995 [Candidatus Pacearchaeota archaeon]|nr:hypothetical protein [Candidatus Pacearchaeota archaeon]
MVARKILSLGMLFGIIFFMTFVSSFSCDLKTTPDSAKSVVMALASDTNSHGEVRDGGGNYNYFISCDFEGTDKCYGDNALFSLSSPTNAHAELLGEGNYDTDVCFGALDCRVGPDIVCEEYEFNVVSFSDSTNAHLGAFEDYSYKVCCEWENNAYWADADDKFTVKTQAAVGDRVALVLNNSGIDIGQNVYDNFVIKERDTFFDDIIRDDDSITGNAVLLGGELSFLSGEWEITLDDFYAGDDSEEFYFVANGVESANSLEVVSRDESIAFCDEFEEENLCSSCSNHIDCAAAYNSANELSENTFGVGCGDILLDDANYKTNCFCQWNVNEGSCNAGVSYLSVESLTVQPHCKNNVIDEDEDGIDCGGDDCGICLNISGILQAVPHCKNSEKDYFGVDNLSNEDGIDCGGDDCGRCDYARTFPKIGSCQYVSLGEDDCSDGFLTLKWNGVWDWGANNGFPTTDNDFSDDPLDYVNDSGNYFYDPLRMSENCNSGNSVIACPAEVELPFFGFFGFMSACVLIALIYLSLIFKNTKAL